MLDSLARFVYRRRRFVAVGAVAFLVVAAGFGNGVASQLDPYGADDPATDSVKAHNLLTDHGYRPRPGDRLQPVHLPPLPRGARQAGSRLAWGRRARGALGGASRDHA